MAKKIIIVEDEPSLRELYADLLEDYELTFAENGQRALELLNAYEPADLYLLDIGLPDMNGLEVARRIRLIHPQARLMMITGYPVQSLRPHLDKLQPNAVMTKPFGIDEFKNQIHRMVASG